MPRSRNERGWKISGAQVLYWWKQKESIKSAPVCNLRLKGAGAKPRLAEVEDKIFDRVLFLRSEKKKVTRDLIAEMDKHLAQAELGNTQFLGSSKWVDGLMQWHDLSLRRTTNLTVLTDDVLTDRAVRYMEFLEARKDRLNMDHTVLMDETAKRTWVDSQLLIKWLDLVFPIIFDASTPRKAIVWDSMRAHTPKAVKARAVKKDLWMFVIPGGLTLYVQAGDIGIYKSFKDKL
eukprot:jgi/Phyca11/17565/fgenesh1_pg.PHYCAscaffold_28_\